MCGCLCEHTEAEEAKETQYDAGLHSFFFNVFSQKVPREVRRCPGPWAYYYNLHC